MAKETRKKQVRVAANAKTKNAPLSDKPLSAKDLAHFREILLQKRREIIGSVTEINNEALAQRTDASGDLSSMPIHMADLGSDTFEQEFELDLMDGERKLLTEIDAALGRISENTYGICEATGKPIKKARLEAQPWARYCVEYARKLERGTAGETRT